MENRNYKRAFTLIELLTVVVIIGMISSIALVTLRDTGEVKAKQYTKQVIRALKDAIASKDGDYFTGFMNDFGTMPPTSYFLINKEDSKKNINFVAPLGETDTDKLGRFKIRHFKTYNKNEHNGRIIPMPFMETEVTAQEKYEDGDSSITDNNGTILYIGFHGGYIGDGIDGEDELKSIKDGWNQPVELITELNVTVASNSDRYLTIKSLGSDGLSEDNVSNNPLRDEFNEYKDDNNLKGAFKDDINISYRYSVFIPKRIDFSDINSSRGYVIYSPMLYYIEGQNDCVEYNTTDAKCSGNYYKYKAFHYDTNVSNLTLENSSWHVGVIKYKLTNDGTDTTLTINDQDSIVLDNNTSIDIEEFYISSGEKKIIRLDDNKTYMRYFNPNKPANITYGE